MLRVDVKAGKPLFDQLRTQVIDGVRSGALPPGSRLPTVRDLAGQLGVAANTVARAYRELESAAIVETDIPSRLDRLPSRPTVPVPSATRGAPARAPAVPSHRACSRCRAGLRSSRLRSRWPAACTASRAMPAEDSAAIRSRPPWKNFADFCRVSSASRSTRCSLRCSCGRSGGCSPITSPPGRATRERLRNLVHRNSSALQ